MGSLHKKMVTDTVNIDAAVQIVLCWLTFEIPCGNTYCDLRVNSQWQICIGRDKTKITFWVTWQKEIGMNACLRPLPLREYQELVQEISSGTNSLVRKQEEEGDTRWFA